MATSPQSAIVWQRGAAVTARDPRPEDSQETPSRNLDEHLQLMRARFKEASDAEQRRRIEAKEDARFEAGYQWDPAIVEWRKKQERHCLTINRIPGFKKQVVNDMRQNRPSIQINPKSESDQELAEIKQGIIRHIEVESNAATADDTAFSCMCTGGFGFSRIVDAWASPKSTDRELRIRWIPNPFQVYFDPNCQEPDWSDANYAFIVQDMTEQAFRKEYPHAQAASLNSFSSIGDEKPYWMPGGKIRVAEYYYAEYVPDVACQLEDGSEEWLSVLQASGQVLDMMEVEIDGKTETIFHVPEGMPAVVQHDPRDRRIIKWEVVSAVDVLKERDWPGQYIPIIPDIGARIDLDGEIMLAGMIRFAREPQRMYNYMYTSFVETVALAPKAPWVVAAGQIEKYKKIWERANKDLMAYLPYDPVTKDGLMAPAPQRQMSEPPIQAFVAGLQMTDQMLKAVFSIYEASLGERGPQESGKAILARQMESDSANFDWLDNHVRYKMLQGKVLLDLLPHYYNRPGRIIKIVRPDNTQYDAVMNQPHEVKGEVKNFDLSRGSEGVTVSAAPAPQTRRKEGVMSMLEIAKVYPPLLEFAGDLLTDAMDFPGADAIRDRWRKMLPPHLQENEKSQYPPEAQQKLAESMDMIQRLSEQLNKALDENDSKRMDQVFETFRAAMKEEGALAREAMKTGSDEIKLLIGPFLDQLNDVQRQTASEATRSAEPSLQDRPAEGLENTSADRGEIT